MEHSAAPPHIHSSNSPTHNSSQTELHIRPYPSPHTACLRHSDPPPAHSPEHSANSPKYSSNAPRRPPTGTHAAHSIHFPQTPSPSHTPSCPSHRAHPPPPPTHRTRPD